MKCKPTDRRLTPEWILGPVRRLSPTGQIDLDVATEPDNPTDAVLYFTARALECAWLPHLPETGGLVWMNPPFSQMAAWVKHWVDTAAVALPDQVLVCLTSVDMTTAWWQALCEGSDCRVELYRRVKCVDPDTGRLMDVARSCALWVRGADASCLEPIGRVISFRASSCSSRRSARERVRCETRTRRAAG